MIEAVVDDLTREFGKVVSPREVRRRVMTAYTYFADARIKSFVPLLVRRRVVSDLRA